MKTLKLFLALILTSAAIYNAGAQNACFGSFLFNAETTNSPTVRFFQDYQLRAQTRIVSKTWYFGDGYSTTDSVATNFLYHYTTTDTVVHVCLYVASYDSVTATTCTDSMCKEVRLCNPGNAATQIGISGTANPVTYTLSAVNFNSAAYPIQAIFDYGDGVRDTGVIATSSSSSVNTHNYVNAGTYVFTAYFNNSLGCGSDSSIFVNVAGSCPQSGFTYTISNDTATLTNTSSGSSSITTYDVVTSDPNNGTAIYQSSSSSFTTISRVPLVPDSVQRICLVTHGPGSCIDTFCTTVLNGACNVSASFTTTIFGGGTAILTYNTSTTNAGPLVYSWSFQGGIPATSTQFEPSVQFPNYGTHDICLIATSPYGCSDTTCTTVTTVAPPLSDTLCGVVFIDANNNGAYDFGENGKPYSTVNIDGTNYITDSLGYYVVPVVSDTHTISVLVPFGYVQTNPIGPTSYTVITDSGDYFCGIDFGLLDDTLILSGYAYTDVNGNGLFDTGEPVRVNTQVNINGANGSYTAVTNMQGYYQQVVHSGTYTVSSAVPSGYTITQPVGTNSYTITAATADITGLNFGIRNNNVTINGLVYIDANNNGVYDSGETKVVNQRINITSTTYVSTNYLGVWSIVRPVGVYNITLTLTGNYINYTSSPASYTVNAVTAGQIYSGNNFGIYLPPNTGDVCVDLSQSSTATPGFPAIYKMLVGNYGNTTMSGTLHLYYDPLLAYNHATIIPTTISTPTYTIDWHLSVGVGQTTQIRAYFDCPTTATVGTPVFNSVFFEPDLGFVDVNMACNEDSLHQSVQASYDPNLKSVSPEGAGGDHFIPNGQQLNYTIMFHNTGTSPAVNVILIDTIQPMLDINSFVVKDASHECHVQVDSNVVTWIFNNIMLPDSASNPDESYGFASFKIKPVSPLNEGTLILNNAGIYFDYNDVVNTANAFNTIEYELDINNLQVDNVTITLQPNPFTEYTTININGEINSVYELRIVDVMGKVVHYEKSAENKVIIKRSNLPAGVYMYELRQKGTLLGSGKMIAQ